MGTEKEVNIISSGFKFSTGMNLFSAYKRTSLEKPIGVFVKFLKELEHENDERRKIFREAEG